MKKFKIAAFVFVVGFSCLFISCEEDPAPTLSEDIKNIVPESTLTKITDLGMPVNKGTNPTNLVNYYKVSPLTLKATNVPSDYAIGSVFADYKFRLYDQDNAKLSIKFDYVSGSETGTGLGGFISGEGNDFSVFVKVHSTSSGSPAEVIHIISGTITTDGIKNFYFSNFMLDDYGDPKNVWMGNDQGRVFYDSDGLSPKVSNLQANSFSKVQNVSAGSGTIIK